MKTGSITTGIILIALTVSAPAFGLPISFSTAHAGPDGYLASASASIDYAVSGSTVTISLENTSPLSDSEGTSNSPAIVGLGFNTTGSAVPADLRLQACSFIPGPGSGELTDISSAWGASADSVLQGTGGQRFDLVLRTDRGVRYGLVNPDAPGETGSCLFEATAQIVLVFTGPPGDLLDWYLRFQNVGQGGEFSVTAPGAPVPEPGTMLLLGTGLISIIGLKKLIG